MTKKPISKNEFEGGRARLPKQLNAKRLLARRGAHELAQAVRAAPCDQSSLKLRTESVAVSSLFPTRRRVRKTESKQLRLVVRSIQQFGICAPILAAPDGEIVHGNLVWLAAKELGLPTIPIIRISHLDERQRQRLAISLNRLGEIGDWDIDSLREVFLELKDEALDLGFETPDIEAICFDYQDELAADEVLPNLPIRPTTRLGDRWVLGPSRIMCGDARATPVLEELFLDHTQPVRVVCTDMPYNVKNFGHVTSDPRHREFAMAAGEMSSAEFSQFTVAWMKVCLLYLMQGGLLATFIDWRSVDKIIEAGRSLGLNLLNIPIWTKTNAGQGSLWRSAHEMFPVFKHGKAPNINNVQSGKFGRSRTNVWEYAGASSLGSQAREGLAYHPTVKPTRMVRDFLLDVTHKGELVLDPFLGSGTTLLAAEEIGRVCLGVEIDPAYCDVAIARWQTFTGQRATLAASGKTFAEIAEDRCAAAAARAPDA